MSSLIATSHQEIFNADYHMIQSSLGSIMCVVFCNTSNFASFTHFTRSLSSLTSLHSLHFLHLHVSLALLVSLTSLASAAAPQLQWYSQDDRVTQALYGHAPPRFGVAENESTGLLTARNGSHSIFLYSKLLPLAALILFAAATEAETLQLNSNSCLHCVILGTMLVSY